MANYFYTYMRFDTQAERKIGLPGLVFQYSLEDFFAKKTLCIETMLDSTKDGIQHYLGRRYLLDIAETEKRPFIEIRNKKTLVLNINRDTELEDREKLLTDWYRKEMERILPGIVRKWEIKSGLQVDSFGIKRMKTKWGSCNPSHKRIWLNLELIKKPINCLEYIVVHEMVHFLERTHNDSFISHMDRIMPRWRTLRDDLNRSPLAHENWEY